MITPASGGDTGVNSRGSDRKILLSDMPANADSDSDLEDVPDELLPDGYHDDNIIDVTIGA